MNTVYARDEVTCKEKSEFLEHMRHDLRTPISGIIGFAELIAKERDKDSILEFTECLVDSSKELMRFFNEILESVNVATGEIPILKRQFNLMEKLAEVVRLYRPKAFEKNLNLELFFDENLPKYVIGDDIRLYRIALELISNALKFTSKGYVKIRAKLTKTEEFKVILLLEVEDTGLGMSLEDQQTLFLRFKRMTPSYSGIYKGAGLGLWIAKQFIDDLNGEIYVESVPTKGTKFTCLIPLKKSLIAELPSGDAALSKWASDEASQQLIVEAQKKRVLVIEDHIPTAVVLKNMLCDLDCNVDIAHDEQTALDFFNKHRYDLLLVDIGLPNVKGYDVAKKIRALENNFKHRVPIVALTAHASTSDKQHCLEASMNAVFTKPLLREKMVSIFEAFVP